MQLLGKFHRHFTHFRQYRFWVKSYRQKRKKDAYFHTDNCQFEPGHNCRVTSVGKFLRKTKLDELPELINVFKGDMSLVGLRPEVAEYVKVFAEEYTYILRARPGLSDDASIKYRDEETLLSAQKDPQVYYRDVILPDKLNLSQQYISKISFNTDLKIILATIKAILNPNVI